MQRGSVGDGSVGQNYSLLESLTKKADLAMYQAKSKGKNSIVAYGSLETGQGLV